MLLVAKADLVVAEISKNHSVKKIATTIRSMPHKRPAALVAPTKSQKSLRLFKENVSIEKILNDPTQTTDFLSNEKAAMLKALQEEYDQRLRSNQAQSVVRNLSRIRTINQKINASDSISLSRTVVCAHGVKLMS